VIRFGWAGYREVTMRGNALGYMGASAALFRELSHLDDVDLDDDASVLVHFCNPVVYAPQPGRRNVLFTMTETALVPDYFGPALRDADAVLAPSRWVRDVFRPVVPASTPLEVVPLGFHPRDHPTRLRTWTPGERFRFLWTGAPNARKGWDHTALAWQAGGFHELDWCELVLKTTDENGDEGRVETRGNVTFDSRYLPRDELRDLFDSAHCLVAPSIGEGFGLMMLEGLASGLPVITTKHSAQVEFLGRWATYCDHEMRDTVASDGTTFRGAYPVTQDLARKMAQTIKRYEAKAKRAWRGGQEMHRDWTWRHSARRLAEAIAALEFGS
jgi:glycosyltransferase involved in cell wall biosynthesis